MWELRESERRTRENPNDPEFEKADVATSSARFNTARGRKLVLRFQENDLDIYFLDFE